MRDNSSGQANSAARIARVKWNSVFKHSLGYVQKRYNNEKKG